MRRAFVCTRCRQVVEDPTGHCRLPHHIIEVEPGSVEKDAAGNVVDCQLLSEKKT